MRHKEGRRNIPHSARLGFNFWSCWDAPVRQDCRLHPRLLLLLLLLSSPGWESCSFAASSSSPPLARSATVSAPLTIIHLSHAAPPPFPPFSPPLFTPPPFSYDLLPPDSLSSHTAVLPQTQGVTKEIKPERRVCVCLPFCKKKQKKHQTFTV